MKALIIDTDSASVKRLTRLLKQGWPGTVIVSTANGKEGIDLVKQEAPNIVVLDVVLRDIFDGFDVLCRIRSFSNVPLIILTHLYAIEYRVQGLNLGADAYVCKSVCPEEILARIKALLRRCS